MELDWYFPRRVQRGEDGAYRWTYDIKAHRNSAPLRFMLAVCLAISGPIALVMLVLTWQYGAGQALLSSLGLLLMMVGLPALIWKLLPPNPSFKMDEALIETWPKGKGNNRHSYKGVRRVVLRPEIDQIRLRWRITGLHIYVPPEDYDFVRDFILAHVPEGAEKR